MGSLGNFSNVAMMDHFIHNVRMLRIQVSQLSSWTALCKSEYSKSGNELSIVTCPDSGYACRVNRSR